MATMEQVRQSQAFKDIGSSLMTALGYGEFFKAEEASVAQGSYVSGTNAALAAQQRDQEAQIA